MRLEPGEVSVAEWITTRGGKQLKLNRRGITLKKPDKAASEMTLQELLTEQRADRQKDWEQSLAEKPNKFRTRFKRL